MRHKSHRAQTTDCQSNFETMGDSMAYYPPHVFVNDMQHRQKIVNSNCKIMGKGGQMFYPMYIYDIRPGLGLVDMK